MPRPPALPPPDVAPSAPTGTGEGGLAWRYEVAWAIAVTLLGFAVRIGAASNSAVEHFDEGVYASNLFMGPDTGYRFPNQHLYAPPLHPAMIEWGMILFGLKTGPMLPGVILGGLTVPLLWWMVRGMFGGVAGLIAALILACDDFHIAHSASALTDVPVTFWILLSVGWLASGIEERGWWRTVLGGAACGIAWWTKYSGWLPLAIVGSAVVVSGMVERQGWREVARRLGHWLVAVAVALAVWSPWLWELQGTGGYQAVAANHRGYVVGWAGWWESASCHLDNFCMWSRTIGWIGFDFGKILLAGSILGIGVAVRRTVSRETVNLDRSPATPRIHLVDLGVWCLLAWWFGVALSIPSYHPYPRLLVPWMLPAIVWLGYCFVVTFATAFPGVMRGVVPEIAVSRETRRTELRVLIAIVCVVLALFSCPGTSRRTGTRASLRDLSRSVAERMTGPMPPGLSRLDTAIYVYGEPALVHHLRVLGYENAVPTSHLGFARQAVPASPVPTFVVIGQHARESARFAEQWAEVHPEGQPSRLVHVADMPVRVSRMVALDHQPPRFDETFTLYRVD
jgi:dolichyl-phosphate-mannose-protein mannosyltransferase